ncbi:hypothetical protein [Brucella pseudogrignonensis]|uniref:hypothetical protein n=1 Tax=Brucella pseudogrignonensis TaxID=419475 RepID=UPI003D98CAD1
MYKLRTIDVWDTLIRRKSHPDFSKLYTARAILLSFNEQLLDEYQDHWSIFRERCKIEGELVDQREYGEYSIKEVLQILLQRVLRGRDLASIAEYCNFYAQLELKFEVRNTYPDPIIEDFIASWPAEETYFLSDFYMPAEDIQYILNHHGIDRFVKSGISSCDTGFNKRLGQLYTNVHEMHNVKPEQHVHFGDNFHSDVTIPTEIGISAVHFEPADEHSQRVRISDYLHNREALYTRISSEIEMLAEDNQANLTASQKAAYELGFKAAPLLVGFILFIAEQAVKDKVEKVYFFTREGEFFLRIWKAIFADNTLSGIELPPVDLLEVSRLSTFCASLRSVSCDELMRLWNLYSTQSMSALLKTLGLIPDQFKAVCDSHNLPLDEDIVYPWQDNRVRALFDDQTFLNLIEKKVEADKSLLLNYLNNHGLSAAEKIGIVDIGWRGTIQDNIGYLVPNTLLFGYYIGLQKFLNIQPENCSKAAFGPNGNESADHLDLLNVVSILEMLCNSPNGSVSGYGVSKDGFVHALRNIDTAENVVFEEFVSYFQDGVIKASSVYADYIDNHVITSAELRPFACEIWRSLVGDSHEDLAKAYMSLSHNEIFGVGKFIDKGEVPSLNDILIGVYDRSRRQEVIQYLRQTQWPQLIWRRKDLGYTHRLALVSVMKAALFYKKVRRLSGV